jgi:HEAT repeat protein
MESALAAGAASDPASLTLLLDLLRDADWRVRYAAAVALQDRRDPAAIPALLETLAAEDAAPLFSSPELEDTILDAAGARPTDIPFPPGTTEEMKEAWRRRGRIKQAVALALGAIGQAAPRAAQDPAVLAVLHRYARDPEQDYAVRAASCHALGEIASPASAACLKQACADEETCTRLEAMKAYRRVVSRKS